ncbi:hypothetical protein EVAR_67290_1 [Eumeta japonica]|uniref:Uncharacterized protein n=1 Tax=Eumeta variegata TaxID=151549 RepID=A0A4C1ZR72_EUMVA|nr:hypothetical protein EVAR_67290_1 [Eumeta japonica]
MKDREIPSAFTQTEVRAKTVRTELVTGRHSTARRAAGPTPGFTFDGPKATTTGGAPRRLRTGERVRNSENFHETSRRIRLGNVAPPDRRAATVIHPMTLAPNEPASAPYTAYKLGRPAWGDTVPTAHELSRLSLIIPLPVVSIRRRRLGAPVAARGSPAPRRKLDIGHAPDYVKALRKERSAKHFRVVSVGTIPDFDPKHDPDSNSGPTIYFDAVLVLNFGSRPGSPFCSSSHFQFRHHYRSRF